MASFKCFVLKRLREIQPMPLFSAYTTKALMPLDQWRKTQRLPDYGLQKGVAAGRSTQEPLHVAIDGNRTYA